MKQNSFLNLFRAAIFLFFASSLFGGSLIEIADHDGIKIFREGEQKNRDFNSSVEFCRDNSLELLDVLDYIKLNESQKDGLETSLYWSKREVSDKSYYFSMRDYDVNLLGKNQNLFLLCKTVKQKPVIKDRLLKKADGIFDKKTELLWQLKSTANKRDRFSLQDAKKYCSLIGDGWRLPTLYELAELAYLKVDIEGEFLKYFDDTELRYYRSVDELGSFSNSSLVVGFKIGSVAGLSNKEAVFARCVKDSSAK